MAEVAEHHTKESCWLVYENKVLDVTNYLDKHPGGWKVMLRLGGKDCTDEIRAFHYDWVINSRLKTLVIGIVTDPPAPTLLQKDFRKLGEDFVQKGWFKPDYTYYYIKAAFLGPLLATVFSLVLGTQSDALHLLAAVLLGIFWWQLAFVGHDGGHMSITANRKKDNAIGLWAGNALAGVSIQWWKATHNVHHALPNTLHTDPDIAHLPVLACDEQIFASVSHFYHQRIMEFDALARNVFIPIQHYLYYPIMSVARFNLYLQSFILLAKDKNCEGRYAEIFHLMIFWTWKVFLLSRLNSWGMVFAFLLLSNAASSILHVQIQLSHYSMPVVDDKDRDFGGDFFTRNVSASLDVSCPEILDWLHGGLQFQTIHHMYPRMCRRFLRKAQPFIVELCKKHNLPYQMMTFTEANIDVFNTLKATALKSKTWSPIIGDSFNAVG